MRPTPCLLLALLLVGCSATRPPEAPPPPPTLAEVNRTLDGASALVFFEDGTFLRGEAEVGPTETIVWVPTPSGTVRREVLPTDSVVRVEIDRSVSVTQGAVRGGLIGALPGAGVALYGEASRANCLAEGQRPRWMCLNTNVTKIGGALLSVLLGSVGAGIGASAAAPEYLGVVYQGPVSRYPDVALRLPAPSEPVSIP